MLWVRGHFWPGEVLLVINLFNLTLLYFRHPTYPRLIHIPIVSAPLAWTYVAILWDGAAAVNARNLPARIVANLFIWGILLLGAFFLLAFKDYTMGFELAILSLGEYHENLDVEQNLIVGSFGSRPVLHQGCCIPVDFCLCYHGMPDCSFGGGWYPWPPRRCQDQT